MDQTKCYVRKYGYNIRTKADSCLGMRHSKKTKLLWSRQRKGQIPWNKDATLTKKSCELCHKKFQGPIWEMAPRKYCSRKCYFIVVHSQKKEPYKPPFINGTNEWKTWVSQQLKTGIKKAGGSPMGMLSKSHSDETRQRMSLSHKGKKKTAEHIRNASQARRGTK